MKMAIDRIEMTYNKTTRKEGRIMVLQSTEDATKYIEAVSYHLDMLTILSQEAGLNSHSAVWLGIHSAFMSSSEDVQTIVDMIGMYINQKVSMEMQERKYGGINYEL